MARKRKVLSKDLAMETKELLMRENFDPLINLIRLANETIKIKDDEGNVIRETPMLCHMLGDKEGYIQIIGINKELMSYVRPKLRSMETKNTHDYNIMVTVKSFEDKMAPAVIDLGEDRKLVANGDED